MKPWEKYQQPAEQQAGPWAKYQAAPVQQEAAPEQESRGIGGVLTDIGAGAIRGAGSIGSTLVLPADMALDAMQGKGLSLESNRARRQAIDAGLQDIVGADPESLAYRGGKLAGEVAGTAGAGGLLAKGAATAGASPTVVNALASGGFNLGSPAATTLAGKAGEAALRAGAGAAVGGTQAAMIDPEQAAAGAVIGGMLPGGVKLSAKAGKAIKDALGTVATNALGATTGAGADAVRTAFEAGRKGSQAFLDNIRNKASFDDIVVSAKDALTNMRIQRQVAYRAGMDDIAKDKAVLEFAGVDDAMARVASMGSYKGVPIRQKAAETVDELKSVVDQWKALDPAAYHTPEGFDALKQAVGDIRDSTQYGTSARRAADQVYNAVKSEINKQAPTYAKVMGDYSAASKTLSELEKALSLGEKASRDTAIRKLQSLMRNNAQTSYGNRLNLAKQLEEQGGAELMPAIAGQAMNSWTPRGMVGAIEKGGMGAAAFLEPTLLAASPLTSPRLVGEAAYGLGRMTGAGQQAASIASSHIFNAITNQNPAMLNALLRSAPVVTLSNLKDRQ